MTDCCIWRHVWVVTENVNLETLTCKTKQRDWKRYILNAAGVCNKAFSQTPVLWKSKQLHEAVAGVWKTISARVGGLLMAVGKVQWSPWPGPDHDTHSLTSVWKVLRLLSGLWRRGWVRGSAAEMAPSFFRDPILGLTHHPSPGTPLWPY